MARGGPVADHRADNLGVLGVALLLLVWIPTVRRLLRAHQHVVHPLGLRPVHLDGHVPGDVPAPRHEERPVPLDLPVRRTQQVRGDEREAAAVDDAPVAPVAHAGSADDLVPGIAGLQAQWHLALTWTPVDGRRGGRKHVDVNVERLSRTGRTASTTRTGHWPGS